MKLISDVIFPIMIFDSQFLPMAVCFLKDCPNLLTQRTDVTEAKRSPHESWKITDQPSLPLSPS